MYARYVQKGESIDYRPAAAVAAGDIVVQDNLVGIARLDIAADMLGSLAVVGVFEAPKAAGAIAAGAAVYWDVTNHAVTTVAAGNPYLGKAVLAAESADELARVLLNAPFVAIAAAE
jgi:Uncharacterized conserved protein